MLDLLLMAATEHIRNACPKCTATVVDVQAMTDSQPTPPRYYCRGCGWYGHNATQIYNVRGVR